MRKNKKVLVVILALIMGALGLGLTVLLPSALSYNGEFESDGIPICTENDSQTKVQMCSDGLGGVIITWIDRRNGVDNNVYAQRIDSNGISHWDPNGTAICTETGDQNDPKLTCDGMGGAIITWRDYRNPDYSIYAQKINSSGSVQWSANGVLIGVSQFMSLFHLYPEICDDGLGGAIITWSDWIPGSQIDIYAQRINSTGVIQWVASGVSICPAIDRQDKPRICSDGIGGAIITWMDMRTEFDIYAQRVNSTGNVQWTTYGIPICALHNSYEPKVCSDGSGTAFIVWEDNRNFKSGIFIQKVNSSGNVQWTTNGIPICTADGIQERLDICSDEMGGALVSWEDFRSSNIDIYAQRIDSNGISHWDPNGTAICTEIGDQNDPKLTCDGMGGAIITWRDYRNSIMDIYAQKINLIGDLKWFSSGVPVCIADGNQNNHQICGDGAGGAFIAWDDYREGSHYDIYAQFVKNLPSTTISPIPFGSYYLLFFVLGVISLLVVKKRKLNENLN